MRLMALVGVATISLCAVQPAAAQTHRSHWGVSGTLTPTWKTPSEIGPLFEVEPVDLSGSEFRVGIVRGRDLSGEWGLSFVRKRIKDGSTIGEIVDSCDGSGCLPEGTLYSFDDVTMTGVALHKFVPFGTIKRRLQIGMTFGAGVARFEGDARGDVYFVDTDFSPNGAPTRVSRHEATVVPAKDLFVIEVVPIGDLQLSVAAILAPGLKVRASGGVSTPGYHIFSLTASYLFGAR